MELEWVRPVIVQALTWRQCTNCAHDHVTWQPPRPRQVPRTTRRPIHELSRCESGVLPSQLDALILQYWSCRISYKQFLTSGGLFFFAEDAAQKECSH